MGYDMINFKDFLVQNNIEQYITEEMIEHYITRTTKHVNLVKANGNYIINNMSIPDDQKFEFLNLLSVHDKSKFENPEKDLYVLISWKYHIEEDKFKEMNLPQWLQEKMVKISEVHLKNNKHHPEYWDDNLISGFLDTQDRDDIDDNLIVNAKKMPNINILEMVCDWTAISQEMHNNSDSTQWANDNVNKRWLFSDEQVNLIYKAIKTLTNFKNFKESI